MTIYYFAYGTNLNRKLFFKKYKNAKFFKKFLLKGYEIVFRSKYRVPDIQKKVKSKVQGVIYIIDKQIEKKLDKYEDYPNLYIKKYFYINKKKIMFYYMKEKSPTKKPSGYYFKIMKEGLHQNKFNKSFLKNL